MNLQDKFAEHCTIKINVVTIDGKRLTKSMFDQLEERDPFNFEYSFKSDKIFGYVNVKNESKQGYNKVIIFEKNGKLYKYNTLPVYIVSISSLQSRYKNLEKYLDYINLFQGNIDGALKAEYTDVHNNYKSPDFEILEDVLNEDGKAIVLRTMMNAGAFMTEVEKHQILI